MVLSLALVAAGVALDVAFIDRTHAAVGSGPHSEKILALTAQYNMVMGDLMVASAVPTHTLSLKQHAMHRFSRREQEGAEASVLLRLGVAGITTSRTTVVWPAPEPP